MFRSKFTTLRILVGLVIIFLYLVFITNFKAVYVNGNSMLPTYKNHQLIVASKNISDISKDDIVILNADNNEQYIKRVVGKPGDEVKYDENRLYINNIQMADVICNRTDSAMILSEDEYYVLGDNRIVSVDSRDFGPVKLSQIAGVIRVKSQKGK